MAARYRRPAQNEETVMCGVCNGSGEGRADGTRCPVCRGLGEIAEDPEDPRDHKDYDYR
jgi:DnaJ-class molecular chaperone